MPATQPWRWGLTVAGFPCLVARKFELCLNAAMENVDGMKLLAANASYPSMPERVEEM